LPLLEASLLHLAQRQSRQASAEFSLPPSSSG